MFPCSRNAWNAGAILSPGDYGHAVKSGASVHALHTAGRLKAVPACNRGSLCLACIHD